MRPRAAAGASSDGAGDGESCGTWEPRFGGAIGSSTGGSAGGVVFCELDLATWTEVVCSGGFESCGVILYMVGGGDVGYSRGAARTGVNLAFFYFYLMGLDLYFFFYKKKCLEMTHWAFFLSVFIVLKS